MPIVSSDGIPITDGQTVTCRIVQTSGETQQFARVQFGVAQLEPKGTGGVLLPGLGGDGAEGGWTSVETTHAYAMTPDDVRKMSPTGSTVWTESIDVGTPGTLYGMALDANGCLYQFSLNLIRKFNPDGSVAWTNTAVSLVGPGCVLPDGSAIFYGSLVDGVGRLDADGASVWFETIGTWVSSITVDADANTYCGCGDGTTRKVDPDGTLLATYNNANQTSRIGAVVVGPDGYIYAGGWTTSGIGAINKIDTDLSATIWANEDSNANITGMALDADGNLLVARGGNRAYRLQPDGASLVQYSELLSSGTNVRDVAVDPDGYIYLAVDASSGTNRRAYRLNPDGTIDWFNQLPARGVFVAADPGPIDAF